MEMRNKRKMIILGGAAFALIVAASVTVSLIRNNSVEAEEFDDGIGVGDELGVHYGGSFDETTGTYRDGHVPDVSEQGSGKDSDDILDIEAEETPAERIKKMDETATEGDIYEGVGSKDRIVLYDNDSAKDLELTEAVDIDENEAVEIMDDFGYETDGYAEHEVICDAGSQEEAESIASQISGTLLSWNEGVATIRIEGSVDELLERLEQEGSNLMLYRKYKLKKK